MKLKKYFCKEFNGVIRFNNERSLLYSGNHRREYKVKYGKQTKKIFLYSIL